MGNTCECTENIERAKQEVELFFGETTEAELTSPTTQPQAPHDSKINLGQQRPSMFQRPKPNVQLYVYNSPIQKKRAISNQKSACQYELQATANSELKLPITQAASRAVSGAKPKIVGKNTSVKKSSRKPRFVKKPSLSMSDYKKFKYIENIESKYEFSDFLGSGAFGQVRKGVNIDTKNEFAIKIMKKEMVKKRRIYVQLLENELSILGSKSHPKIIRVADLLEDSENYYVVSELVEGGELFKRLCQLENFTEDQAVNIIQQVMLGLNYLHLQNITHRDMKPENILLVSKDLNDFDVKISDLGFAQQFETGGKPMTLVLGSPLYMAPELINRVAYTEKVDVWSLGVITYQLLSGRTPFESRNMKKIDYNIKRKKITFENTDYEFWDDISQDAKDFILACLDRNQTTRPSIAQLFKMPWIQNYSAKQVQIVDYEDANQRSIHKNIINFPELNQFQKVVLSLVSGLCASKQEIDELQKEFLRLDKQKTGTLKLEDLKKELHSRFGDRYENMDWLQILEGCDLNNDGVIDFQDFLSCSVDRRALVHNAEIKRAFQLIDADKDGKLSREDFQSLFNAYEQSGAKNRKMNDQLWKEILLEADTNGDGEISFSEFKRAMRDMIRKSWLRATDRSPSRSFSPAKSTSPEKSPIKFMEMSPVKESLGLRCPTREKTDQLFSRVDENSASSPMKRPSLTRRLAENPESPDYRRGARGKKAQGEIISPERNPFRHRKNRFAMDDTDGPYDTAHQENENEGHRQKSKKKFNFNNEFSSSKKKSKYSGQFNLVEIDTSCSPIKQMR